MDYCYSSNSAQRSQESLDEETSYHLMGNCEVYCHQGETIEEKCINIVKFLLKNSD